METSPENLLTNLNLIFYVPYNQSLTQKRTNSNKVPDLIKVPKNLWATSNTDIGKIKSVEL